MIKPSIRNAVLAATLFALAQIGQAQENMGIHGHWTVTVRNPDGTLASRYEFENSITDMGKSLVLNLLGGATLTNGAPTWQLDIGGSLCFQKPSTALGDCQISVQPTRPILPGTTNFASLPLEMSGTVKMDGNGQIMSVATQVTNLVGKTVHGQAPQNGTLTFSSRDLTKPDSAAGTTQPPINVQAGQNVDFTVDISIS